MKRGRRVYAFVALSVVAVATGPVGCHSSAQGDCSNGECGCPQGETCDFTCASPPCAIDCLPGSQCHAACADGDCTCEDGASCWFVCNSGPCHVDCVGHNATCGGQCWDGQCTCGPGSSCAFQCESPPCHTSCQPGSSCTVDCGSWAGSACDIVTCGAGRATTCPDGHTLVCGASCPK